MQAFEYPAFLPAMNFLRKPNEVQFVHLRKSAVLRARREVSSTRIRSKGQGFFLASTTSEFRASRPAVAAPEMAAS
jgi:hypothetical protein